MEHFRYEESCDDAGDVWLVTLVLRRSFLLFLKSIFRCFMKYVLYTRRFVTMPVDYCFMDASLNCYAVPFYFFYPKNTLAGLWGTLSRGRFLNELARIIADGRWLLGLRDILCTTGFTLIFLNYCSVYTGFQSLFASFYKPLSIYRTQFCYEILDRITNTLHLSVIIFS